jgi:hypothetical protein
MQQTNLLPHTTKHAGLCFDLPPGVNNIGQQTITNISLHYVQKY